MRTSSAFVAALLLPAASLLVAGTAVGQVTDPMRAPVRVVADPPYDLLHVDGTVRVAPSGWDVDLRLTALALIGDEDSLRLEETGLRVESVSVTRVGVGDSVAIRIRYHVPVGVALRSDGSATWTRSARTGGASWLPFPHGIPDRFTARFSFSGADVLAGGLARSGNDTAHVVIPGAVAAADLLVVAGDPGESFRSGRFVYHGADLAVDRVAAFADTFEDAWSFLAGETGFRPPVDTVRVVFVDAGPGADEAGSGTALADLSLLDSSRSGRDPTFAIALLAARFWAGGSLRAAAWTDSWLTEALAHHFAVRFVLERRGEGAAWAALTALGDAYFREAARYRRPLVWDRWMHPADLVDAHAAGRGVWVLRTLEGLLGSAAVREAARELFRDGRPPYTEHLRAALERRTGRRLGPFFDAFVYGAGHPVLAVRQRFDPARESLALTVEQMQDGPLVPATFPIETRVAWRALSGDGSTAVTLDAPGTTVNVHTRVEPRFVESDPDGLLLAETRTNRDLSAFTALLRYGTLPARHRAARDMADLAADPALPLALRMALERESEPVVRRAIMETAARMPPSPSLETLALRAIRDTDPAVRESAVRLFAPFTGRDDVAAVVADVASSDTVFAVQAAAVETLAAMRARDAEYFARAALITDSEHDVIRAAGFRALALLETPQEDLQEEMLGHSEPGLPADRVRAALVVAPRLQPDRAVRRRLLDLLEDRRFRVREAAARVAGHHLDPDTVGRLLEEEPDSGVKAALIESLAAARGRN